MNRVLRGFTLAEVLITLGVIGVVAAISLPTLITNVTERRNSERHANIALKLTQAMEHMRATGKLVTYASTEDFVNEISGAYQWFWADGSGPSGTFVNKKAPVLLFNGDGSPSTGRDTGFKFDQYPVICIE